MRKQESYGAENDAFVRASDQTNATVKKLELIYLGRRDGDKNLNHGLNTENLAMAFKLQKCLEMLAQYTAQQNSAALRQSKQLKQCERSGIGLTEATEESRERLFMVIEH